MEKRIGASILICLDTYALIEIHNGNQRYSRLELNNVVITNPTLAEFYLYLTRKYNESTAEHWKKKFEAFSRIVGLGSWIQAVKIKKDNQRLSYFDCVSYSYARTNNMVFVTGDKELLKFPGTRKP